MAFTQKEVDEMYKILSRLESGLAIPIQNHRSEEINRTGCAFGVKNRKKEYILIYQNYKNLSPYRFNLLKKLSKNVSYTLQITYPESNLICVGWKF